MFSHKHRPDGPGYTAVLTWAIDEARHHSATATIADIQQLALRECAVHLDWDDVWHATKNDTSPH
ncbi:hypothetical protein [Streptomyces sp. NPDC057910]|uniref:hypothetical protein n=1 Tax=Streptomyces sp. NPDC057910 TaxID=3346278 RepID=UPI0036DFD7DF